MEIEKVSAQEICIRAKNKGKVAVVLKDHTGKEKKWNVEILHENPKNLPDVSKDDFREIRFRWNNY